MFEEPFYLVKVFLYRAGWSEPAKVAFDPFKVILAPLNVYLHRSEQRFDPIEAFLDWLSPWTPECT